jgi:uncharacterized membrane protein YeiH
MATVTIAEYVEWMGLWYAAMDAHGHIIRDVLVKTKPSFLRENGFVQNVLLTSLDQLRQELSVVQEELKRLALICAGGYSWELATICWCKFFQIDHTVLQIY